MSHDLALKKAIALAKGQMHSGGYDFENAVINAIRCYVDNSSADTPEERKPLNPIVSAERQLLEKQCSDLRNENTLLREYYNINMQIEHLGGSHLPEQEFNTRLGNLLAAETKIKNEIEENMRDKQGPIPNHQD